MAKWKGKIIYMKKIIISSFMGSGSSAVTDLLSEYSNVNCKNGDFEYVFLHCPDGVFDLEDKLLKGNNIIRSYDAIRKFKKTMYDLYSKKYWWFGNYKQKVSESFIEIVDNFIDEIIQYEFHGYWYEHEKTNLIKSWLNIAISLFNHITNKNIKFKRLYDDRMMISFIDSENFYKASRKMLNRFFCLLINDKEQAIVLDQLLLPHNLFRANNYLDEDTKMIVVHRDPRDVFLLNKYVWNTKSVGIPFPLNADQFCLFYKQMMNTVKDYSNNDNILDIKFEDLVYNYDVTVNKIENFLNLKSCAHIYKFSKFNPNKSKMNTNITFDNLLAQEEKLIIQENLFKYIYRFESNEIISNIEEIF